MKIVQNKVRDSEYNINQYCLENCHLLPVSSEQVNLIEISSEQSLAKESNTAKISTILGILILITVAWVGIISYLRIAKINKELRNYTATGSSANSKKSLNNFNSIPCTKCQFFHNNSYLKCAVHPSKVLRSEAKECSDYSLRPHKKKSVLYKLIDDNRDSR
ncbi:MAG: hypothetical protein ACRC2S_05305 [Waterburya sp.]